MAQTLLKVSHGGHGLEPNESLRFIASYASLAAAVPDLLDTVAPTLRLVE